MDRCKQLLHKSCAQTPVRRNRVRGTCSLSFQSLIRLVIGTRLFWHRYCKEDTDLPLWAHLSSSPSPLVPAPAYRQPQGYLSSPLAHSGGRRETWPSQVKWQFTAYHKFLSNTPIAQFWPIRRLHWTSTQKLNIVSVSCIHQCCLLLSPHPLPLLQSVRQLHLWALQCNTQLRCLVCRKEEEKEREKIM